MPDESQINTYDYQTTLPLESSPAPSFVLLLNYNGIKLTSTEFTTSAGALAWVNINWKTFGTWSVSGDTLFITDCLAGVGSLNMSLVVDEDDENILYLDSSAPQTIIDVWGLAAVDVSVNRARSSDTNWKAKVGALTPLFVEPITGTTAWWAKYQTVSDGYNIQASEATARGTTLAAVLDGVGNTTYGYGFFEDALAYMKVLPIKPKVIISLDLFRPIILGSYTTTYAEIDYVVSKCLSEGITIRSFQLCYELGISDAEDLFPTAVSIQTATQTVTNYINTTYPTIPVSVDANNANDISPRKPTLNALQNAVTGSTMVRQYFQFDETLTTYEQLRSRIAEFPSFVSDFMDEFTNGQKMRLAQSTFKIGNPFRNKFAEGLVYAELIMNVINQNILYNRIADFVQYNLSRVVNSDASELPSYQTLLKMRGAMNNDGKIVATFTNSNLVVLAVKSGLGAEVYILNHSAGIESFDAVQLNGVEKTVTVDSNYGNPDGVTPIAYLSAGRSVLLQPHSLTLVTTS